VKATEVLNKVSRERLGAQAKELLKGGGVTKV
jgi:hypothetical protein